MGNNCLICVKAQIVDFSPGVDSERPDNNMGNESSEKKNRLKWVSMLVANY